MNRVLRALLVLLAVAPAASAIDIPVTGLKLIMVDKTAVSAGAKAVFVAKDPAIDKGTGENPGTIFAGLGIAYDGTSGSFEMPMGPGWLVNKPTVAKYVNNAAPTGGAVKVSVVKPGSLIKVVSKSLGDTAIDISTAPVGPVYVTHMVINEADAFRHCTQFGTCVHKLIAGGSGYKVVCKGDSTGDPTCAAAPTPQCCGIGDLGFCGWLDPFLCVTSGGTPGGPGTTCDSVTGTCIGSASAGACCEGIPGPAGAICIAGPPIDSTNCAGQSGTFSASGVCAPDGSCS